jgi:hypothetical protein
MSSPKHVYILTVGARTGDSVKIFGSRFYYRIISLRRVLLPIVMTLISVG